MQKKLRKNILELSCVSEYAVKAHSRIIEHNHAKPGVSTFSLQKSIYSWENASYLGTAWHENFTKVTVVHIFNCVLAMSAVHKTSINKSL